MVEVCKIVSTYEKLIEIKKKVKKIRREYSIRKNKDYLIYKRGREKKEIRILKKKEKMLENSIEEKIERPKKRSDCSSVQRPCMFVSCRYNMLIDISTDGSITFPYGEDFEYADEGNSCCLDIVEQFPDGLTIPEISKYLYIQEGQLNNVAQAAIHNLREFVLEESEVEDLRVRNHEIISTANSCDTLCEFLDPLIRKYPVLPYQYFIDRLLELDLDVFPRDYLEDMLDPILFLTYNDPQTVYISESVLRGKYKCSSGTIAKLSSVPVVKFEEDVWYYMPSVYVTAKQRRELKRKCVTLFKDYGFNESKNKKDRSNSRRS